MLAIAASDFGLSVHREQNRRWPSKLRQVLLLRCLNPIDAATSAKGGVSSLELRLLVASLNAFHSIGQILRNTFHTAKHIAIGADPFIIMVNSIKTDFANEEVLVCVAVAVNCYHTLPYIFHQFI